MVGCRGASRKVIVDLVRGPIVAACISFGLLVGVNADADGVADAKALVQSAKDMAVELQNASPPPDAETIGRVQQEALANLRDARSLFQESGAKTTRDADLAYVYGDLLVRLGDLDLAAITLKNAFALAPENAEYALGYSTVLVQLGAGQEREAARALRAVVALDPESDRAASAHALLAEVYRSSGLYDLTLESVDLALAINPGHSGALFLKAVCLVRLGRFLEANTLMDEVSALAPALAADERGRLYDAVRDFERRNLWVANTAEEHAAYGKMLIRVNRLPDSMDSLRHAVRLNPDDAIIWNLLGSVYREANRIDEARDAFEHSLGIDPDQERTRQVLEQLAPATLGTP